MTNALVKGKQYRCRAGHILVNSLLLVNACDGYLRQVSKELGIPLPRLKRYLDCTKPAIPFSQRRTDYLLLAGYLRCSVYDLFVAY
jgi:hypothetical protein